MLTVSSKVLSLSNEAVMLVRGGRILYANSRAEKLVGSDCVGRTLRELFPPEIAEAQARLFAADTTFGGKRLSVRTSKLEDMQAFFLSEGGLSAAPVNDALLYSLRSALMNLRLSEELCRARCEKLGDAELADGLRAMRAGVFRISRLLDNAAVVRGVASDDLKATLSVLDLAALCRSIVESVSLLRGDIRFELFAEGETCLTGDRVLLEQMIFNLISNCLVHAEGLSRVTLRITPTPTHLILSVSDDGCGIGEEAMGGVFERYRDGFALDGMSRGAGLGLSVVRGVARLHEGTLLIESRAGSGTSARVSLSRHVGGASLGAPQPEGPADVGTLLVGLADCLPPECFDGTLLD
ncbi:MAG: PAS domain-containing protein [Oscillospiraceae bacterium]|nr:PAS domain-containing protein [Oscillospiraceae bacterium]